MVIEFIRFKEMFLEGSEMELFFSRFWKLFFYLRYIGRGNFFLVGVLLGFVLGFWVRKIYYVEGNIFFRIF